MCNAQVQYLVKYKGKKELLWANKYTLRGYEEEVSLFEAILDNERKKTPPQDDAENLKVERSKFFLFGLCEF